VRTTQERRAHLFVEKCALLRKEERTFLSRSAHYSGKKSAPMQVEESIMCQAELAEVCLGHRNGIISGIQ
jgi:hypothetical protein